MHNEMRNSQLHGRCDPDTQTRQLRLIPNGTTRTYNCYHDEIQANRRDHPFLVHGVLLVPTDRVATVVARLRSLRGNFNNQVHYSKIKASVGPKFECARKWLEWYLREGRIYCPFKVFAVDQDGFRPFPYRSEDGYPDHILLNTTATFYGGIRWSVPKRTDAVVLRVFCDSTGDEDFVKAVGHLGSLLRIKSHESRERFRKKNARRASKGIRGRKHIPPLVRVSGDPLFLSSDPIKASEEELGHVELLQLTDVLLGSLWDAFRPKLGPPQQYGRRILCDEWAAVSDDSNPWTTLRYPFGKSISISLYPDENGRAYPARRARIQRGQSQLPIMDETWLNRRDRSSETLVSVA
jgi:hypothetical protein